MEIDEVFLSSNIKYLRNKNKLTQKDIGKICDKKNTAVANWEKGIREPNAVDLAKMANYFHIAVDDLIQKDLRFDNATPVETRAVETVSIPVLGIIKAGIPIEAQEDIIEYIDIPKDWLRGGKKFYGLKISGDSMFPKYQQDDIVIFEQDVDMVDANHKDCAVMVNGFDATFKNVSLNQAGITLIPLNINNSDGYQPTFYDADQIKELPVRIIGIAKEKRTRL